MRLLKAMLGLLALVGVAKSQMFRLQNGSQYKVDTLREKFFKLCPMAAASNLPAEWHLASQNYTSPIQSNLVAKLMYILDVNDLEMSMTVTMIFRIFYIIPCGRDIRSELMPGWEKIPQGFLDRIQFEVPAKDHWWPDMQHINAIGESRPLREERLIKVRPFRGYKDGWPGPSFLIYAVRPFKSVCMDFDFTRFPFDDAACTFEIENENLYTEVIINVENVAVQGGYQPLRDDDLWIFKNFSGYNWIADDFHHVTLTLELKRKYKYYVGNVFVPTFALFLLQVFGLIMDPCHPDRPTYCVTINLAMAVMLTLIFGLIPKTAQEVYLVNIVVNLTIICALITTYTLAACFIGHLKYAKLLLWHKDGKSGIRIIRLCDISAAIISFLSGFIVICYYLSLMVYG